MVKGQQILMFVMMLRSTNFSILGQTTEKYQTLLPTYLVINISTHTVQLDIPGDKILPQNQNQQVTEHMVAQGHGK